MKESCNGGEQAKDRLDRRRPHGIAHGRAPAQGRLRSRHLEPHPLQGRAARETRRQGRRQSRRAQDVDVLFSIVSTGKDLDQVYFGKNSVTGHGGKLPKIFVDCSTISVEESAAIRDRLKQLGSDYVTAPVSGNAKVIKAGHSFAALPGRRA